MAIVEDCISLLEHGRCRNHGIDGFCPFKTVGLRMECNHYVASYKEVDSKGGEE